MSYVVFVFQKLFGYPRDKATKLMLDVHHKGKAAVSHGTREKCEFDVSRLHAHGLWAAMQKDSSSAANQGQTRPSEAGSPSASAGPSAMSSVHLSQLRQLVDPDA